MSLIAANRVSSGSPRFRLFDSCSIKSATHAQCEAGRTGSEMQCSASKIKHVGLPCAASKQGSEKIALRRSSTQRAQQRITEQ